MSTEPIEELFVFLMILMAILVGTNYWVRFHILRNLRQRHPEVWRQLGAPTLILNNSIQIGVSTLRFIWSNQHSSLRDPELTQKIHLERALHVLGALLLAAGIVLALKYVLLR